MPSVSHAVFLIWEDMAMVVNKDTVKTLRFVTACYTFILIIKLAVYFVSGVLVVLAEALHTLNDLIISIFLLVASYYACKAADDKHMFGHGRVQNVAAFLAATLFISVTAYKLFEEAIITLIKHPTREFQHLNYAVAMFLVNMVVVAIPMIKMMRQKKWEPTIKAQFIELVNDQLAIVAALVGIFFIIWGHPIADPIATITVGAIIAGNAFMLFKDSFSFLLGRSPGPEILTRFTEVARSVPGVIDVHDLRAEYIGPDHIHADMHIRVKRGQTIEEAHRIADEVYKKVEKEAGCPYCVIHVDPAKED
jgi:cation diffusion facilitator family transporter